MIFRLKILPMRLLKELTRFKQSNDEVSTIDHT
jgi:hypothetical protein